MILFLEFSSFASSPPLQKWENNEKINRKISFFLVLLSFSIIAFLIEYIKGGKACLDCHMIYNLVSRHLNVYIKPSTLSLNEILCLCMWIEWENQFDDVFLHWLSIHEFSRLLWEKKVIEEINETDEIFFLISVLFYCFIKI